MRWKQEALKESCDGKSANQRGESGAVSVVEKPSSATFVEIGWIIPNI